MGRRCSAPRPAQPTTCAHPLVAHSCGCPGPTDLACSLTCSNIKHTQRLVINERLDTAVAPISREARTNVTQCCCFNKGTAWMRATFDKNAYVPGEEARVVVEANNESSVDISAIRSKLKRRLTLHDNSGRQHVMVDTVAQGTYPVSGVTCPSLGCACPPASRLLP